MREEQGVRAKAAIMDAEKEEEQESALDSLLAKVDMAAPLEIPMDSGQILTINQEQFIEYYLPVDATRAEKAKCFNETRAAGLNPAIRGDCHYFKTGGGPLSLFVGYHVYVRKAYANGLNHIHRPELVYNEATGDLESCVITLEIEGRPDFVWETWFSEVVAERNGEPNTRWQKAERQMLIKCSVVNTFRMAGIASIGVLPPTREEMPDFPAPGYKNLTQPQLDAHDVETEPPTPGEVTALTHQIDLTPLRKSYRGKLAEREMFPDDTMRKMWQSEIIGKASTSDWDAMDYNNATSEIESGRCEQWVQDNQPKPEPDPPVTKNGTPVKEAVEKAVADDIAEKASAGDKFLDDLPDEPEDATDEPVPSNTQAEPKEEQEPPPAFEVWDITSKTRKRIGELLAELKIYDTPRSPKFKERVKPQLGGRWLLKMQAMMESEGLDIISSLEAEIAAEANHDDEPVDGLSPEAQDKEHADQESDKHKTYPGVEDGEYEKQEAEAREQLAKEQEAKKIGEIVDDDPLNTGLDSDRFCDTPEWKELHNIYVSRLKAQLDETGEAAFISPESQSAWEQEITGRTGVVHWDLEVFEIVHKALDDLGIVVVWDTTPATEEPEPAGEKAPDEQYKKMEALFSELYPDKKYAMGTEPARDLIYAVTGKRFKYLNTISSSDASDVIHTLEDNISDMKADAEAREKDAAKHII